MPRNRIGLATLPVPFREPDKDREANIRHPVRKMLSGIAAFQSFPDFAVPSPEGSGSAGLRWESGVGLRLHDGLALLPVFVHPMFGDFSLAGSGASSRAVLRFFRPFPSVGPWPE